MQPMSFKFDPEAAKKAGSAAIINETGTYEGVILHAQVGFGTDSQSQSLELRFESNGAKSDYLRINFIGRDGEPTFGMDLVNALMWTAGVRDLIPEQQQTSEGTAWVFPALTNKKTGLVLQKELRTKQSDGSDTYQMNIRHVFQPGTRLTYAEFAEKLPAEAIDKLMLGLKDVDKRQPVAGNVHNTAQRGAPTGNRYANQNTGAAPQSKLQQAAANRNNAPQPEPDFDDDIPF
ncbi:hypothetical protein NB703_003030 [Pantoea ananatis]|uniref:DUF669 domain-containing protein n=1 Tax=Pantoea ananas TaxID=553 RepID=A0AAJ1FQU6_PANAN|nr:hypothetical protein [Pantoea ananatis]MCW0344937.1 hypothetical protein [Pantoea ananatis]